MRTPAYDVRVFLDPVDSKNKEMLVAYMAKSIANVVAVGNATGRPTAPDQMNESWADVTNWESCDSEQIKHDIAAKLETFKTDEIADLFELSLSVMVNGLVQSLKPEDLYIGLTMSMMAVLLLDE